MFAHNPKVLYTYVVGTEIRINGSALKHGITPREIRSAIEYPRFRMLAVSRRDPWRVVYLFIGQVGQEAHIEVAAELTAEPAWDAFHAMLLRQVTVDRVRAATDERVQFPASRTQRK